MGQFAEEGIDDVLDTYFATPSDYYVALVANQTINKTDSWTDLTEVSGTGYAKIALTSVTVSTYATDDRKAVANQVTFSATGNWTIARQWALLTPAVASGTWTLIAFNALDAEYTLVSGQSIDVTVQINAAG